VTYAKLATGILAAIGAMALVVVVAPKPSKPKAFDPKPEQEPPPTPKPPEMTLYERVVDDAQTYAAYKPEGFTEIEFIRSIGRHVPVALVREALADLVVRGDIAPVDREDKLVAYRQVVR
jgi:hypothetical protein